MNRSALVSTMLEQLEPAWSVGGAVCMLSGHAGIGKTHVAGEFLSHLPRGVASMQSGAPPTSTPALLPICRAVSSCTTGRVRAELATVLEEYGDTIPLFKESVGPLLRARRASQFGKAMSRDIAPSETYTFVALVDLLRKLSKRCRLVLFLDDIQWLDASSITFLGHLVEELGTFPIFILLAARTNGSEPPSVASVKETLRRHPNRFLHDFVVPPLSNTDVAALSAEVLEGRAAFTTNELNWLRRTSKGSPQYLREVLSLLKGRANLIEENGSWTFAEKPSRLIVPPSLLEITRVRLEPVISRDDGVETLIQFAAVIGRQFSTHLLTQLTDRSQQRVHSLLRRVASETGYIRRVGQQAVYEFDHDLTREAVLHCLGDSSREKHLQVAQCLMLDTSAPAAETARHFEMGGDESLAAVQFGIAAKEAWDRCGYADSVKYAHRQDRLLEKAGIDPQSPERLKSAELEAQALLAAERYEEASRILRSRAGPPTSRRILHLLGRSLTRLPVDERHQEAVNVLLGALQVAKADGDTLGIAQISTDLVYAFDAVGRFPDSQAAYRAAYSASVAAEAVVLRVRLLRLTCMFWQPDKVVEATTAAIKIAKKNKLKYEEALCCNNLGAAHLDLADIESAEKNFRLCQDLLSRMGGYRRDVPINNLGVVALTKRELPTARRLFEEALSASRDHHNQLFIRSNLAVARAQSRDLPGAEGLLGDLVLEADETGDLYYRDCIRYNFARVLLLGGKPEDAANVICQCPPRQAREDNDLVQGKRAAILLEAYDLLQPRLTDPDLIASRRLLERTTKPQAWLYRLPWEIVHIEFWED